jgi:wyosine [tRNA(Phe)-imidazoG37] synthetase (radical SAM superfamily)
MSSSDPIPERRYVGTAFGLPRTFLGHRFVYLVVSQRAQGLSVGINVNPGKQCNFKCVYCEVDRTIPARDWAVDIPTMAAELEGLLERVRAKSLHELAGFSHLPAELLELKEVALSGDGEPTLSPQFFDIVTEVVALRSWGPYFKIVLITNTAGLPLPEVRKALDLLSGQDEIWLKLDAGTQEYMDRINVPDLKLGDVMANILMVARARPVVIQSLFPMFRREEPSEEEINHYVQRLEDLKAGGAMISLVQVYSSHRPAHTPDCAHLPLATLSRISRKIKTITGLKAEIF